MVVAPVGAARPGPQNWGCCSAIPTQRVQLQLSDACVRPQHMIKYRYIPFTHGKRTYGGKEDMGKTFAS